MIIVTAVLKVTFFSGFIGVVHSAAPGRYQQQADLLLRTVVGEVYQPVTKQD